MNDHAHTPMDLTKNQSLVMGALTNSDGPLSAYTILDQLREHGFRAPLQVYRALDKLVEFGLVHRLESLNAFVACRHPECDGHETLAFMICETCNQVTELSDAALAGHLKSIGESRGFSLKKTTIELRGICQVCQAA